MHKTHYHAKIIYLYLDKIHVYPWGMVISKEIFRTFEFISMKNSYEDRL